MEFVEPDDEPGPSRRPLPPEDRLWRHPSELGPNPSETLSMGSVFSAEVQRGESGEDRPSLWLVAAVSAVSAGLLATGLTVVVVGLVGASDRIDPVIERQMEPRPIEAVSSGGVPDAAHQARPAVAQLRQDGSAAVIGSAVIFRSDGHMLTSASVVGDAMSVEVLLDDGRTARGRVVGTDPETDTAVVKIDGGPFATAVLGTANDLRVGQQVIAIGRPAELAGGPSVTVGVISALNRTVPRAAGGTLFDMVQTDARVPTGWPGGALLDTSGSVVGIASGAGASASSPSGFGFAVPIDVARWVAGHLIDSGRVPWVWLGIEGRDADGVSGQGPSRGARVTHVMSGSPAYRVGLSADDVIVGVDGQPVSSMAQLVVGVRQREPGDAVTLDVVRLGEPTSIEVVLVERPAAA